MALNDRLHPTMVARMLCMLEVIEGQKQARREAIHVTWEAKTSNVGIQRCVTWEHLDHHVAKVVPT